MTVETIPGGVYTPITTFFHEDYTLDLKTQVQHAKFLYDNGIQGLVVAGSMGEAAHLSSHERYTLVKTLREAIPDPQFKLIAGAPPLNVQDGIKESVQAKEAGANFMIFLVPGFFGGHLTSQQGIVDYFHAIADQSALPIMVYNYPGVSNNVTLTIDTFHQLSHHGNIVGVKLTHFAMDTYTLLGKDIRLHKNNFSPFTGLGQVLVPAMAVGIRGTIDGLSGVFPKVMVRLFELIKQGKWEEAGELQFLVTQADMMIGDYNLVGTKFAINKYHGMGGYLAGRPPLNQGIDGEKFKKYEEAFDELMKVEKTLA